MDSKSSSFAKQGASSSISTNFDLQPVLVNLAALRKQTIWGSKQRVARQGGQGFIFKGPRYRSDSPQSEPHRTDSRQDQGDSTEHVSVETIDTAEVLMKRYLDPDRHVTAHRQRQVSGGHLPRLPSILPCFAYVVQHWHGTGSTGAATGHRNRKQALRQQGVHSIRPPDFGQQIKRLQHMHSLCRQQFFYNGSEPQGEIGCAVRVKVTAANVVAAGHVCHICHVCRSHSECCYNWSENVRLRCLLWEIRYCEGLGLAVPASVQGQHRKYIGTFRSLSMA